ncbi:hypothetical protein [Streptomyces sp. NPDC018347]|uniref:hypothetical protein n=1 Tax=Streptomyces sp. NPDC018347 TaxID=3157193 RepID=UPI0033CEA403
MPRRVPALLAAFASGACPAGVIASTMGLGREEQEGSRVRRHAGDERATGIAAGALVGGQGALVAGTGRPAEAHGPAAAGTAAGPASALAVAVRPTTYAPGPTRPAVPHVPQSRTPRSPARARSGTRPR